MDTYIDSNIGLKSRGVLYHILTSNDQRKYYQDFSCSFVNADWTLFDRLVKVTFTVFTL